MTVTFNYTPLRDILQQCVEVLVRHLDAAFARIWTLNSSENVLELQASAGIYTHTNGGHSRVPVGHFKIGVIAQERQPLLTNSVIGDPRIHDQEWAMQEGMVAFAGYPLLIEERLVGVMAVFARQPLSEETLKAMASVANALGLGIQRKQAEEALQESEERFRSLCACSPIGIFLTDTEGVCIYNNPRWQEIAGFTFEQALGKGWAQPVHPDDRERVFTDWSAYARGGQEYSDEFRLQTPEGIVRWVYVRSSPMFSDNSKLVGHVGTVEDITERVQIETALKQSEQQLRAIVDNVPLGLFTSNNLGCQFVNQYWLSRMGLTLEEALGTGWMRKIHPEDREWVAQKVTETKKANQGFEGEFRFLDRAGNIYWMLSRTVPIRDEIGQVQFYQGFLVDITSRKQAEEALRESEERLQAILDNSTALIYLKDTQGRYIFINRQCENLMHVTREQIVGKTDYEMFPKEIADTYQVNNLRVLETRTPMEWEEVAPHDDGLYTYISLKFPLYNSAGVPYAVCGISTDITQRKQAEEELRKLHDQLEIRVRQRTAELAQANKDLQIENTERKRAEETLRQSDERFRSLSACSPVGIFLIDVEGYCTYTNPRYQAICGFTYKQALKKGWAQFVHPDDREWVVADWFAHARAGQEWSQQYRFQLREGIVRWVYVRTSPMLGDRSEIIGHVGTIEDITSRKQAEEKLLHNALYDALTGLPNRALFINRLQQAIEYGKRHKENLFAVLFLDLDRFKAINDSLGHTLGDQLLIAVANRLKACLRPTDTAARLGGDEFTILLEGINDVSDAIHIVERIQEQLALPFALSGQEVFTTASIGLALNNPQAGTPDYDRPEDLLRYADTAMYRAKALGKKRYEIFNTEMYATALAKLQLETDLRRAIERQEFRVYYQPIVSLESGRIKGFEALVRWQHPDRGFVSLADFLPVAEETGLIVAIGYWVLREACCQMQAWLKRRSANSPLTISVNLSQKQFSQSDLIQQIERVLQETGLEACRLVLEITESIIMENSSSATAAFSQLRELGIELSIDDFGTGYSSLGRLHHFPISVLKIDRSFVGRMGTVKGDLEITETIVTLAHRLGLEVTAEGVEMADQLAQLRELKCEYGQGYFFSPPLDREAATALIVANSQW